MNEYKYSDISLGLEESFDIEVTSEMLEGFLKISKDNNPLHTDLDYSKAKGFKDRVVYGMLTASFYSTLVGVYLPGKYCLLQGIDIQFTKPVFVGDILKITGKISYMNDAYKQLEIKALIRNQDNIKVSKSLIKVGVRDE